MRLIVSHIEIEEEERKERERRNKPIASKRKADQMSEAPRGGDNMANACKIFVLIF